MHTHTHTHIGAAFYHRGSAQELVYVTEGKITILLDAAKKEMTHTFLLIFFAFITSPRCWWRSPPPPFPNFKQSLN